MNKKKQYVLPISKEGSLTLPDELTDNLGWKIGDTLQLESTKDGCIYISKIDINAPDPQKPNLVAYLTQDENTDFPDVDISLDRCNDKGAGNNDKNK